MLVLLSDIHLTDETTAPNVHPTAFQLLGEEIGTSAQERGAEDIHVVLLGDIIDLVRTNYWHAHNIPPQDRPWGGDLDPETAMNRAAAIPGQFDAVLASILATESGQALFSMLQGLAAAAGKPTRVTYVTGNHDRVLNNFDVLRQRIAAALPGVPVHFATELLAPEYGVLARHGHQWDDNCHGWKLYTDVLKKGHVGRFAPEAHRVMAIGEPLTAELMSGLVYHVETALNRQNPADRLFLHNLMDVNNLRPPTDVLRTALDGVLDCSLARRWDDLKKDLLVSGDITDYLDKARGILRRPQGLAKLQALLPVVDKLCSAYRSIPGTAGKDDLVSGAQQEFQNGLPPEIQYIVYGHTHTARHACFSAEPSGAVRMYINAGTYLPLIARALDEQSFSRSHRMTLAFFYKDVEDQEGRQGRGPTLDFWDGVRRKTYTV
jgi:UDP-2,3-diacylglucosamine pyrophosphatase LpxH